MTSEFFKKKRPWSKYKDFILEYYLEPYIAKVAQLKKPILIVDCFAGCGKFGDGEPGSPLIIADAISRWRSKGTAISGEFIEADLNNYHLLENALAPFGDCTLARFSNFEDHVNELASRARSETVFLYVDPYTVKGLEFDKLNSVYQQIRKEGASVEVLMNFNVATFMRWALAALKRVVPVDATSDDPDYQADDPNERLEIATLNAIAGGDDWQSIANNETLSFAEKLDAFTRAYVEKLSASFKYVCAYPVKSKYEHQTPKYMLIYATRHADGLQLMNDAMCKARVQFLGSQFQSGNLFDMTPDVEVPDTAALRRELIEVVRQFGPITRKSLRMRTLLSFFCQFTQKDLNGTIHELLKSGQLVSSTGKARINDDVLLRLAE